MAIFNPIIHKLQDQGSSGLQNMAKFTQWFAHQHIDSLFAVGFLHLGEGRNPKVAYQVVFSSVLVEL